MTNGSEKSLEALVAMLIGQTKKAPRAGAEKKQTSALAASATNAPLPKEGTPQWKLSTRWTDVALIVVAQEVICDNCNARDISSQPFVYVQRFHPSFGIHREALASHSPRHGELPRRVETITSRVMFCRHCFVGNDCPSGQLRLGFDLATPGTFELNGEFHITDLFSSGPQAGAEKLEGIIPLETKPRPSAPVAPFFPPVVI